ncbi:hypothetical protein ABIB25_000654 [Nakamurella sp. UYEF19]|uniref:hypothetical protein n=1 Tax=Nakamurella sp. UYEF19 TaxID=1756392 RepID=UPI003395EA42
MKAPRVHLHAVLAWWSMRRSPGVPKVGDVVVCPDGLSRALPKDLVDLDAEDLAAMGVAPGSQPDFFVPR